MLTNPPQLTQAVQSESPIDRAMLVLFDRIDRLTIYVSDMEKKCAIVMRSVPQDSPSDKVPCAGANVSPMTDRINTAAVRIMEVTDRMAVMLEGSEL